MLGAIRELFIRKPPEAVTRTYIALVAAARNPFFYHELKVPDSIDGRFDLIVLHLFLLQERLLSEGDLVPLAPSALTPPASDSLTPRTPATKAERATFCQLLSETFVRDLDANLREMGVADTGVSKRMKTMGHAYHGRLQAYAAATADDHALRAALARNLYGTVAEGDITALHQMAALVRHIQAHLASIPVTQILDGNVTWPRFS